MVLSVYPMGRYCLTVSMDRTMTEVLGWISATLLAVCGIFQMVETIDLGSVQGLSPWFIWTWFLGEIFGLYYVCKKKQYPLIVNYLLNLLATSVLLCYLILQ